MTGVQTCALPILSTITSCPFRRRNGHDVIVDNEENKKSEASSLASDFLFDECPDMSKKHLSADCEYTEAGVSQPCLRCR